MEKEMQVFDRISFRAIQSHTILISNIFPRDSDSKYQIEQDWKLISDSLWNTWKNFIFSKFLTQGLAKWTRSKVGVTEIS